MVEMLDHRDLRARGSQTHQPLVRVAQERRGKAEDDFFGVRVEGDDRRPGICAGARSPAFDASENRLAPQCGA